MGIASFELWKLGWIHYWRITKLWIWFYKNLFSWQKSPSYLRIWVTCQPIQTSHTFKSTIVRATNVIISFYLNYIIHCNREVKLILHIFTSISPYMEEKLSGTTLSLLLHTCHELQLWKCSYYGVRDHITRCVITMHSNAFRPNKIVSRLMFFVYFYDLSGIIQTKYNMKRIWKPSNQLLIFTEHCIFSEIFQMFCLKLSLIYAKPLENVHTLYSVGSRYWKRSIKNFNLCSEWRLNPLTGDYWTKGHWLPLSNTY